MRMAVVTYCNDGDGYAESKTCKTETRGYIVTTPRLQAYSWFKS